MDRKMVRKFLTIWQRVEEGLFVKKYNQLSIQPTKAIMMVYFYYSKARSTCDAAFIGTIIKYDEHRIKRKELLKYLKENRNKIRNAFVQNLMNGYIEKGKGVKVEGYDEDDIIAMIDTNSKRLKKQMYMDGAGNIWQGYNDLIAKIRKNKPQWSFSSYTKGI